MDKAEQLFNIEARLRAAATNYAEWVKATNRTPAILNEKRKELRQAAINFANAVRAL